MRTSVSKPRIPTIDLRPWLSGDPEARAAIARTLDDALQSAGFFLVTGHGVDPALRSRIREAARTFFRMPADVKQPYTAKVGGRGWLGPGAEANGYSEGTQTPPDLKESLTFATHEPFEDPAVNAEWYAPNVWPAEVPELRSLCEEYLERMGELEKGLLSSSARHSASEPTSSPGTWTIRHTASTSTGIRASRSSGSRSRGSSASARTPTSGR